MSVTSSLQTQARDAYRRKDYKNAIDLFGRAIGRAPSVQLYDNRAACHDKLADLPSALQDAKRAIQLCREDPTGYLRAGRILVKSDKKTAALDIYAYGLGRVKHVGAGYEQLKKVHDELQGELAPQRSLDPFTVLPREMALLILEHLSFRQRVLATKVSKDWRTFIHSEPKLWSHLDLTGGKFKVSTKFVSKAINVARGRITSATLNRLWDFEKVLNALVKHCQIEKITLGDVGLLGPDIATTLAKGKMLKELRIMPGTKLANRALWELFPLCQTTLQVLAIEEPIDLRVLNDRTSILSNLGQLKKLDITVASTQDSRQWIEFLTAISQGAPSLEHLRFHTTLVIPRWASSERLDLTAATKLKTADLRLPINSARSLSVPPSLEQLHLHSPSPGEFRAFLHDTDIDIMAPHRGLNLNDLPQLTRLSMNFKGLMTSHLEPFFERRCLNDEADPQPALAPIIQFSLLLPGFPDSQDELRLPIRLRTDLESLTILDCLKLDDKRLMQLAIQLPKLRFLDITGSGITGAGVKDIIIERDSIRHLVLDKCLNVSRDAVDWARARGVKVDYQFTTFDGNSGRKVRH